MTPEVERKLLGLVGLGYRGRLVVVGVQQVRDAAFRGKLAFAVVARDVSRHSLDKVVPLLTARNVRFVEIDSGEVLGRAVGRESTAAVGVIDHQLARGMRSVLEAGAKTARDTGAEGAQ